MAFRWYTYTRRRDNCNMFNNNRIDELPEQRLYACHLFRRTCGRFEFRDNRWTILFYSPGGTENIFIKKKKKPPPVYIRIHDSSCIIQICISRVRICRTVKKQVPYAFFVRLTAGGVFRERERERDSHIILYRSFCRLLRRSLFFFFVISPADDDPVVIALYTIIAAACRCSKTRQRILYNNIIRRVGRA